MTLIYNPVSLELYTSSSKIPYFAIAFCTIETNFKSEYDLRILLFIVKFVTISYLQSLVWSYRV